MWAGDDWWESSTGTSMEVFGVTVLVKEGIQRRSNNEFCHWRKERRREVQGICGLWTDNGNACCSRLCKWFKYFMRWISSSCNCSISFWFFNSTSGVTQWSCTDFGDRLYLFLGRTLWWHTHCSSQRHRSCPLADSARFYCLQSGLQIFHELLVIPQTVLWRINTSTLIH